MRLDPATEATAPEFWMQLREAYQMRNLVTHEYHRMDASVVWDTVKIDLPAMDSLIAKFLKNRFQE
jgi:uncharacterized protein with HEPN domain